MKDILVIGGGFAGVWSAAGAVRALREAGATTEDVRVTLVSGGDDMVVRPRLYEADPERKRLPLDRILGPIGVRRITATVTDLDTDAHTVLAVDRNGEQRTLSYDKLVLATGSKLVRPGGLPGIEHAFDVDTLPAAAALDHHLRRLPQHPRAAGRYTVVVVGAGFTGIELATELHDRLHAVADPEGAAEEVRVLVVDRADVLGPELGEGPRPHIEKVVDGLRIERRLGNTLAAVTPYQVTLADGEVIPAATVVWTAGMVASPLTARIPAERDRLGRLPVDEHLRVTGVPDVYAAGDTAAAVVEGGHRTMQSCQHAQPMGKCAGHNVAAELLGRELMPFAPDPYGTCLDLGPAGAVVAEGWDRAVQMTGAEAKVVKEQINTLWIYPPVDDAEKILAKAGQQANGA
ncbi:dehydrogenase [Streptomyces sp. CS113]|uniref:NAD(P)/FAD-dependent oxidoreductase n=1 Tax=Streptomyces sp. CS113 TaxID=1982761 RepID=UPI000B40CCCF|nr:FAD-dependent oxidoreductase [Streptomyces sp. CS113]OWA13894.1 dehydrogenase [Streptomyces sp. CS113]